MSGLGTVLLSAHQESTARACVHEPESEPEPKPEGEHTPGSGPGSEDCESPAATRSERAELPEDDDVFLDERVLRTIQHYINGPKWLTPFWWDVACTVGWLGAMWTATGFYRVYIPGMSLPSGFAAFVALLPCTWVPVCRTLRYELREVEGGGFVTRQLQEKVSRDAAEKLYRSMRIMLGVQILLSFACCVQNLTILLGVTGLGIDVALALFFFAFGFPLGLVRFIGMLATVVACAYSISDRTQKVERRCARHHEVLQLSSRTASSAASSPSQLAAETERLLSTGRELGVLLGTTHRYAHASSLAAQ